MSGIKRITKKYYLRQIVCCWMIFCMAFVLPVKIAMAADPLPSPDLTAGPDGFVAGAGTITDSGDILNPWTNVNVTSTESIIHWNSLDTAGGELLNYEQTGVLNAAVLNRVTSGIGTEFYGNLTADAGMSIYMINPAGILFGGGSTVNVTQLVASSLNLSNGEFVKAINGESFTFTDGASAGLVENHGTIIGAEAVALIGKTVLNTGDISADYVIMAAGDTVTISEVGSAVAVKVEVTMPDQNPGEYTYKIDNGGENGTGAVYAQHVALAAGDIWSSAYINAYDSGGEAEATIDIKAEGNVGVTNQVVALAESHGEGGSATATVTVDAGGDLELTAEDGSTASIQAIATHGLTNTATVLVDVKGDITLKATGKKWLGKYSNPQMLTSSASIQATAGAVEDMSEKNNAYVEVMADGDLELSAIDGGVALIKANTIEGTENISEVFICADQVTVNAQGGFEKKATDVWLGSLASIEAIAESGVGTAQNNTADVKIGAREGINVTALSDFYSDRYPGSTEAAASINARAIDGEENTASVFVCSQDDVLVKAEKGGIAKIKSLAGANVATNNIETALVYALDYTIPGNFLSQATTTVISHEGDVTVESTGAGTVIDSVISEGSKASIESEVYGNPNEDTAVTQVYGNNVEVIGKITVSGKGSSIESKERYALEGLVLDEGIYHSEDETLDGAALLVDSPGNADVDCPDCDDPEPDPDPDPDPVAAPIPFRIPRIEGCPELTLAASIELGINSDTLQVAIGNALALNPNIQPCEACESLVDASNILRDEDGSRMAAMLAAFNAQASPDAPFTPEMGASMTMALADAAQGAQYASSVAEYIDAFVMYVAVLDTELGAPVGDSVAFVMNKYGEGISANQSIAEFVASRIANMEVFGG